MSKTPDTEVLVCMGLGARYVIEGSTLMDCSRCGGPIWVAPSGLEVLSHHPAMVLMCIPCVPIAVAENDGEAVWHGPLS